MTENVLEGQAAIVTGAGSGLGKAHAIALAELGANVVVNELPARAAAAAAVVEEIGATGGTAVPALVSAADPDAGERLVQASLDAFGRLDIVVSNAGILRSGLFPDVADETWQSHMTIHLDGALRLARAAWPVMTARNYGRLVFTTSSAGLFGAHGLVAYGAAKMGVAGLVKVLAQEAAGTGIRVNAIAPLAWTPMSQAGGRTGSTAQILGPDFENYHPEHVSQVVALLSHPNCPAQGQILAAGGGRVAEIVVAETRGYRAAAPSCADILDHWDEVCGRENLAVPDGLRGELALYAHRSSLR